MIEAWQPERSGPPRPMTPTDKRACTLTQNDAAWQHPAVYLAGRDSDWFFLANESESKTWPVYREHYERWVSRAARGEVLEGPERVALSAPTQEALSAEEQVTHLARLRKEIGL